MMNFRYFYVLFFALLMTGCNSEGDNVGEGKPIVRGLKTVVVRDVEKNIERKYPGVLQPSSISPLSFEVSGKLGLINLDVGQSVKKGDVLATVDSKTLELQVESAEAVVSQAKSSARTAREDYERQLTLFKKKVVAKAAVDKSKNAFASADASLVQANKQLASAKENLTKTDLVAPFDGIINTVEANSFTSVSPGAAVVTIYSASAFEVSFSVNYEVITLLAVGKKVKIRLADSPSIQLNAHVSEMGAKADTVSSFPVIVRLDEVNPALKAGMAIEVSVDFAVEKQQGYLLPLSILALDSDSLRQKPVQTEEGGTVFVFDKGTSTVKRREVTIAGIRENSLIITSGVKLGERVASAGVSFLHDGLKVHLLPDVDRK